MNIKKTKKNKLVIKTGLLAAAFAGILSVAGSQSAEASGDEKKMLQKGKAAAAKKEPMVKCYGVNSCKGTTMCGGPEGNSCKGMNKCKGKGWNTMTVAKCNELGGQDVVKAIKAAREKKEKAKTN